MVRCWDVWRARQTYQVVRQGAQEVLETNSGVGIYLRRSVAIWMWPFEIDVIANDGVSEEISFLKLLSKDNFQISF